MSTTICHTINLHQKYQNNSEHVSYISLESFTEFLLEQTDLKFHKQWRRYYRSIRVRFIFKISCEFHPRPHSRIAERIIRNSEL